MGRAYSSQKCMESVTDGCCNHVRNLDAFFHRSVLSVEHKHQLPVITLFRSVLSTPPTEWWVRHITSDPQAAVGLGIIARSSDTITPASVPHVVAAATVRPRAAGRPALRTR